MFAKKGFTLVEILFVLIIAAGIMAYAVPSYKRAKERSTYEAATGKLVDLGNAVLALRRDLALQGISITNFPETTGTNFYEASGSKNYSSASDHSNKSLKEAFQYKSFADTAAGRKSRNTWLVGSLKPLGYLDSLELDTAYNYFVVASPNASGSGFCCLMPSTTPAPVVACMCKSANQGCFAGAVFLENGEVVRTPGSSCTL